VRAITTLGYRNRYFCYSRTVACSSESAMLLSSGDSPQNASSILSGEGFDEVQRGESPFVVSALCYLPTPDLPGRPGRSIRQPRRSTAVRNGWISKTSFGVLADELLAVLRSLRNRLRPMARGPWYTGYAHAGVPRVADPNASPIQCRICPWIGF
jgi:hypothetical protein